MTAAVRCQVDLANYSGLLYISLGGRACYRHTHNIILYCYGTVLMFFSAGAYMSTGGEHALTSKAMPTNKVCLYFNTKGAQLWLAKYVQ